MVPSGWFSTAVFMTQLSISLNNQHDQQLMWYTGPRIQCNPSQHKTIMQHLYNVGPTRSSNTVQMLYDYFVLAGMLFCEPGKAKRQSLQLLHFGIARLWKWMSIRESNRMLHSECGLMFWRWRILFCRFPHVFQIPESIIPYNAELFVFELWKLKGFFNLTSS